jgi:hypothetical protein
MQRYNLWVVNSERALAICWGSQSEMNDLALLACIEENVYILPDGEEPQGYCHRLQSMPLWTRVAPAKCDNHSITPIP